MHIFGFWIPKLTELPLEQRENTKQFQLSEIGDKDVVTGELKYKNSRLEIKLERAIPTFPKHITLKEYHKDEKSGIFFFYTEEELNSSTVDNIQRSIYSSFKEMFHSHIHHSGDEDSILHAYHEKLNSLEETSKAELWLKCIKHYILLYEEKFQATASFFSDSLYKLRELYYEFTSKNIDDNSCQELSKKAQKFAHSSSSLLHELYGLIGELSYWKFLLNQLSNSSRVNQEKEGDSTSKHFNSWKLYTFKINSLKDEMAFFLNSSRYIAETCSRSREHQIAINSLSIGIWGFSVGVASLFFTTVFSICTLFFQKQLMELPFLGKVLITLVTLFLLACISLGLKRWLEVKNVD